jgi:FKBP-type peptidyl-prolyl cis-trans isomerase SlyD
MKIAKNTVVTFHYDLFNENGDELETTRDVDPLLALVGADNIAPGLEKAMIGRGAGESFEVSLLPHLAYGDRKEDQVTRVSAKYLKHEGKLSPGQVVRLDSNQGVKICTVVKVGKFSVDVDLNHPLAGQTIRYKVDILETRAATDDEIQHGHAHGAGGHQH